MLLPVACAELCISWYNIHNAVIWQHIMFYTILKIVIYAILSLLLKDADITLCVSIPLERRSRSFCDTEVPVCMLLNPMTMGHQRRVV